MKKAIQREVGQYYAGPDHKYKVQKFRPPALYLVVKTYSTY